MRTWCMSIFVFTSPPVSSHATISCVSILQPQAPFFDSTQAPNAAFSFRVGLGNVIKGWDEGLLMMQPGELATLTISPDFGYGSGGFPTWGIPPDAELVFEVQLLSVD